MNTCTAGVIYVRRKTTLALVITKAAGQRTRLLYSTYILTRNSSISVEASASVSSATTAVVAAKDTSYVFILAIYQPEVYWSWLTRSRIAGFFSRLAADNVNANANADVQC